LEDSYTSRSKVWRRQSPEFVAAKKLKKKLNRTKRRQEVRFIKNIKKTMDIYDELGQEMNATLRALSSISH
jgi:2-C-methyl-D-erythritol 4-phosphate cytidylyltransferase